jgi:hypothetical protein
VQLLRDHADDPELQKEWRNVKAIAKKRAAAKMETLTGIKINAEALFDVQVWSSLQCNAGGLALGTAVCRPGAMHACVLQLLCC